MTEEWSRRKFLEKSAKLAGGFALASVLSPFGIPVVGAREPISALGLESKEALKSPGLEYGIGINGVPDNRLVADEIRLPLNRAAFDPPEKCKGRSPRSLDHFYLKGDEAKNLHDQGTKINLVLELGNGIIIDSAEHLREMLVWADRFFGFRKNDKITIGNEHSSLRGGKGYPVASYISQFFETQRLIKQNFEGVEVGIQSEAWYGKGEYFATLLSALSRRKIFFDFASINCYGSAYESARRVDLYRRVLDKYGFSDLPIEVSEIGVRVSDNPKTEKPTYSGQIIVDQDGQAEFILKSLCLLMVAGARRANWFSYQDDPENTQLPTYGLIGAYGLERKGLRAFNFASKLLEGVTGHLTEVRPSYTRLIFKKKDNSTICVYWNNLDREFPVPINGFTVYNAVGERVMSTRMRNVEELGPVVFLPKSDGDEGGSSRVFIG